MKYEEAKEKYIQAWGALGSSWGVNRTMAQIHALLMVSTEPLSAEEIMEDLKISRGNTNMNVRALIDWGLASKVLKPGERKEFFTTDKDPWKLAVQVAKERRKRELDPILQILNEVQEVEPIDEKSKHFKEMTKELNGFAKQADSFLDMFIKAENKWWTKFIMKIKG
ncbi:GbsR/MarR family transcriptional regulator [Aureibacter tunicatorum]|uniref:HTH-type transcriptional regulator n=1 Tax=Aureibacter tunicatorum TaxID=866807 RepID=A0AAE4BTV0_9BACT|nr:transcriptional regulator [Aureibacter tunicatorum]MDR6240340.1 DNA-binding transcriptional regulator GbsR (MarR family) [Aureibacter tunicatorum]BDD05779.1 hypothetical protein AUTU_32620 [Aureibacter tunicatorum]